MKLIAPVLLVALAMVGCASATPSSTPGQTSPSASPLPTVTPSKSTASDPVEASTQPTVGAEPTLTGDFPEPGATIYPGAPVLVDLGLGELADLWASLGLSCESHAIGGPESPASYNVHCEGIDPKLDLEAVAEAAYWTPDGVVLISVIVNPSMGGSIDAAAAANEWVLPFARLAGGDAAVTWVQHHIDDAACRQGCTERVAGRQLSYYTGTRGGQKLDVTQVAS
jgi:hypothetical protein